MSQTTSTSVEKATADKAVEEFTDADRQFKSLQRRAGALARSNLVPRALKDKPDDVLLVMVQAEELGLSPVQGLSHLYVIEGKVVPSAQVQTGLARRDGHEIVVTELSRERCVVKGRRRGSRDWLTVEYTIEDAREAGRLDRWVERKYKNQGDRYDRTEKFVVGDESGFFTVDDRRAKGLPIEVPQWAQQAMDKGQIKAFDNWQKFRKDMLRARGLSMLCRTHFSDSLLGIGGPDAFTPEELGEDWSADAEPDTPRDNQTHDQDSIPDDIEDADLVEPETTSGGAHDVPLDVAGGAHPPASPTGAPPGTLYDPDDPERPFEAA